MNSYKMKKENHGKTRLEKEIAIEAMSKSLLRVERTLIHLKIKKILLINTNEQLLSCSSQTLYAAIELPTSCREIFRLFT